MRNLLVTGGAGFIGSNFVRYWVQKHPRDRLINLDALTYAGNPDNLSDIEGTANYRFVHGDICDAKLVRELFRIEQIDTVVHFAAESHVDRSITAPETFVRTNVLGTFNLLETCRMVWGGDNTSCQFLHVSTDEVFGSLEFGQDPFTETTAYSPNSPYSASKASSDHLVRAYFHTYSLSVFTTNCSNNYGPFQFPEKLIPLVILNALEGKEVPIYGDGKYVRDWLHVEDHCRALDAVLGRGKNGETYNIGGCNEWTNIDIVTHICNRLDSLHPSESRKLGLITHIKDRPGHDRRYAIDATKIMGSLGWKPIYTFETGIEQTMQWYLDNTQWCDRVRTGDYKAFYSHQYNGE